MNTQMALDVARRCGELVALCAQFQASFGRRPNLRPDSPHDEWQQHHAILDKQTEIATLLASNIVKSPGETVNQWWKRQDVIDLSIANDIHRESARLISCCAYLDADPVGNQWSYSVQASQAAIAALLHPIARQRATELELAGAD